MTYRLDDLITWESDQGEALEREIEKACRFLPDSIRHDVRDEFLHRVFELGRDCTRRELRRATDAVRKRSKRRFANVQKFRESQRPDRLTSGQLVSHPRQHDLTAQTGEEVLEALSLLPRSYREVLLLRFMFQFTWDEVARELGLSVGGAMRRKVEAGRLLKTLLE